MTRFNKIISDYPNQLQDIDDEQIWHNSDIYERHKPYQPKESSVMGVSPIIPMKDTDEEL